MFLIVFICKNVCKITKVLVVVEVVVCVALGVVGLVRQLLQAPEVGDSEERGRESRAEHTLSASFFNHAEFG